jgi:hypothetical protein
LLDDGIRVLRSAGASRLIRQTRKYLEVATGRNTVQITYRIATVSREDGRLRYSRTFSKFPEALEAFGASG